MKDLGQTILGILLWLYGIMSQIMAIVFFIGYCRSDDSILEIIFIDTLLSEIKGLLWIIFIWF
jgi:hypothetical protein